MEIRKMQIDDLDAVMAMDMDLEKFIPARFARRTFEQVDTWIAVKEQGELLGFICLDGYRVVKIVSNGSYGVVRALIIHVKLERDGAEVTGVCREELAKHYERMFKVERLGIRPHYFGVGIDGIEVKL